VRVGFDEWSGADVVLATGWQTVHRVLMLGGVKARAYLVQDHEPDFFPESAERRWAEQTYRLGLHCITAGRWLRDLVAHNYGATASWFSLGVDRSTYSPRPVPRAEVKRQRPGVQIELFGDTRGTPRVLDARDLGLLDRESLAEAYSRATVGVVLSLTNYSLIAQEMMACGLPCVEADTPSTRAAFDVKGSVTLAPLTVNGVAGAVMRLLDDAALRDDQREHGLHLAQRRTWENAAEDFEGGIREALRLAAE
jgi:glycosyltransferase involved in cell wall biosynthesis